MWQNSNSWSPAIEVQYQNWVRTTWTKTLFTEPGPLQNIKLDCADAVLTMRLLFAYENKLPFAIKDPSSNRLISNDMVRFDSIVSEEERFRAFAQYLYKMISTQSLPSNSYPVALNRASVHAGVFIRTAQASHHSWTVKDLDRAGIPYLIYASRPAKTTLFERHYYPSMGFLWGEQDLNGDQISANLQTPGDAASGVGYQMFRYPQDILKPVWQVPGYSLDQYQMNRIAWGKTAQRALQINSETPEESALRLLGQACNEASDRIAAVRDAATAMSRKTPNYCFNAQEYDDLSTPSRDSRTVGVFRDLLAIYETGRTAFSPTTLEKIERVVLNRDPGEYCSLRIASGKRITLGEAVSLAVAGKWSSNPNDSLLARWGKEASPTEHAQSCPTY